MKKMHMVWVVLAGLLVFGCSAKNPQRFGQVAGEQAGHQPAKSSKGEEEIRKEVQAELDREEIAREERARREQEARAEAERQEQARKEALVKEQAYLQKTLEQIEWANQQVKEIQQIASSNGDPLTAGDYDRPLAVIGKNSSLAQKTLKMEKDPKVVRSIHETIVKNILADHHLKKMFDERAEKKNPQFVKPSPTALR